MPDTCLLLKMEIVVYIKKALIQLLKIRMLWVIELRKTGEFDQYYNVYEDYNPYQISQVFKFDDHEEVKYIIIYDLMALLFLNLFFL